MHLMIKCVKLMPRQLLTFKMFKIEWICKPVSHKNFEIATCKGGFSLLLLGGMGDCAVLWIYKYRRTNTRYNYEPV